ncbi:hypothetical protein Tco_0873201 [Tanacetum coccineum]
MSVRLADRSFQYPARIAENMLVEVVIRVKQKQLNLGVGTERMIFKIDSAIKHSYSNDDTCFSIDVINEILEEYFDALLDEGSKIFYSIEGTILKEEIFSEFNRFIAMTPDENYDSESDTEEPSFEKITINADYKIKTSLEEPPMDLELKHLHDNLEYHKIQLLDDKKPVVQKQIRLNPNMQEVVKKEILKLLDTGIIYPIADSPWVSPIHCVPKKGDITVVTNKNNELVPTRTVTGWRLLNYGMPTMAGVDIDTLTMEQYLALSRENQAPGVVKPEIEGNVNFEIKSQFMRELREDSFSGNKDEDAHHHIG